MWGYVRATNIALLVVFARALPGTAIKILNLTNVSASANSALPDSDPYAIQAKGVLAQFSEYSRRLNESRQAAEGQYRAVKEQEAFLHWSSTQEMKKLRSLLESATGEAAQAEATTMLERLDRLRFDQQGIMDRSARFWEEKSAEEKERTRQVQAQIRLEQSLSNATALKESSAARQIQDITDVEKKRLNQWVDNLGEQVKAERNALYLEGRRQGLNQTELVEMLAKPMKEIANETMEGPPPAAVFAHDANRALTVD